MKLVVLAKILRPHGYKGAFVVEASGGDDSNLAHLDEVLVGNSEDSALSHRVLEASWMPSGWKLVLEGITTEDQVKTLRGYHLYADRDKLSAPGPNEFYVSDLIGADIVEHDSERVVGRLLRVESDGQDRWWVETPSGAELPIPASGHFIHRVDVVKKIIYVKNLADLP